MSYFPVAQPQTSRYSEQSTSAVAATAVAADADSDDDEVLGNAGELDVDMAEPTLADRLKALNVSQKKERKAAARKQRAIDADDDDVEVASESDDDDEEEFNLADEDDDLEGRAVPATTLTTTLIQALHSQDGPLLESCLTHSNPNLVRSTVKRLPSGGLVLSLLEALVERLGRQKKGREGLASVKRARALIAWLRETLVVHVGFLVTIPSLVNRLAALHASLTQRLALQPTLLALNGRLDLVMSQIDLRQDRARAASRRQQLAAASAAKKPSSGRRYVEGESTDEDEPHGDDDDDLSEGDVEDVVLGAGGSDDDEDSSDVDSDFLDEEDGEGGAPRHKVSTWPSHFIGLFPQSRLTAKLNPLPLIAAERRRIAARPRGGRRRGL
jgi:U3 small nucleolar RNA-associated protein 5